MALYTKIGDFGDTNLRGGVSVSKSSPRICAIGEVDELNAALGIARAENKDNTIEEILEIIQGHLFDLGSDLSSPGNNNKKLIAGSHCEQLENRIDRLEEKLPKITNFILPGGSKTASLLHFSRAVCRRAERAVVRLRGSRRDEESAACDCAEIIKYMNRLSDLLFVLARYANHVAGVAEIKWEGLRHLRR